MVNGAVQREDAPDAKRFRFREVAVSSLADVAAAIEEAGAEGEIAIRGEPLPETPRGQLVLRRSRAKAGEPATFREVPRRWLMVDIDRGLGVGPDWYTDPEGAVWLALAELPEAFRGASCHWALSSGACMPAHGSRPATASATVKLHLTFWLSRPVGSAEAKAWLHGHPADPALYNPVQPHYIAAPQFLDGLVDPVPRRSGIWQGRSPVVTVPDDLGAIVRDHAARGLGSAASANLDADDIDTLVASTRNLIIEDGSAVRAYILSAGGKFAWRHGRDPDPQQQADNEAALVEALSALAGEFRGAREVETYDIPRIVAEAYASAPERTPIPESVAAFAATLTGKAAEPAPELPPLVELSPADAAAELRRVVTEAFTLAAMGQRFVKAIRVTAGTGKTAVVLEICRLFPALRVDIYVPTDRLAQQLVATARSKGILAGWIRGRGAKIGDGKRMCARFAEVEEAQKAGVLNIRDSFCRRHIEGGPPELCREYANCRFVNQLRPGGHLPDDYIPSGNLEQFMHPQVRVYSHAHLFLHGQSKELIWPDAPRGKPHLVVIDEDCIDAAARAVHFPAERLVADRREDVPNAGQRDMLYDMGRRVLDAWRTGRDPREVVTPAEAALAADIESGAIGHAAVSLSPAMDRSRVIRVLGKLKGSGAVKTWRFWKLFAEELAAMDRPLQRILFRPNAPWGDGEQRDLITMLWRAELHIPEDAAVLLLDATGNETMFGALWPDVEVTSIHAKRNARVVQVRSTVFSESSLRPKRRSGPKVVAGTARRRAELLDLAAWETDGGRNRVFVGTYKGVAELPEFVAPEGVSVGTFGALRGSNAWEGYEVGIVAGRLRPDPEPVEWRARALFGDRHILQLGIEKYPEVVRRYRMRDGSVNMGKVEVHPDPYCDAVLQSMREAGIVQTMDRPRLVHRDDPARIILATNVPLEDVIVDQLVDWQSLLPSQADRTIERLGCWPDAPTELHRLAPDLWPSAEAAKKAKQRQAKGGQTPMGNLYRQLSPLSAAAYRRPGQSGDSCMAYLFHHVATVAEAELFLKSRGFGDDIRVVGIVDLRPAQPAPAEARETRKFDARPEESQARDDAAPIAPEIAAAPRPPVPPMPAGGLSTVEGDCRVEPSVAGIRQTWHLAAPLPMVEDYRISGGHRFTRRPSPVTPPPSPAACFVEIGDGRRPPDRVWMPGTPADIAAIAEQLPRATFRVLRQHGATLH